LAGFSIIIHLELEFRLGPLKAEIHEPNDLIQKIQIFLDPENIFGRFCLKNEGNGPFQMVHRNHPIKILMVQRAKLDGVANLN